MNKNLLTSKYVKNNILYYLFLEHMRKRSKGVTTVECIYIILQCWSFNYNYVRWFELVQSGQNVRDIYTRTPKSRYIKIVYIPKYIADGVRYMSCQGSVPREENGKMPGGRRKGEEKG